jgi:uncharacterized protein YjbI with pentapeptide repeats
MPAPETSRCQFTTPLDQEFYDPETESLLDTVDGEWQCPHHVFAPDSRHTEARFCPFHRESDDTSERLDTEAVAEACYRLIIGAADEMPEFQRLPDPVSKYVDRTIADERITPAEQVQFIGGSFGDLCFDYRRVDGHSNVPVDFREATFDGRVSLRSGGVGHEIRFDGATFASAARFVETTFERRAQFSGARFEEGVDFHHATFESWAGFDNAVLKGEANFRGVEFTHGLFGIGMRCAAAADFMAARFDAVANFAESTFEQGAVFSSTRFGGNATFREVTFESPVLLSRNFVDDTDVNDRWDRLTVVDRSVPDACVVFRNATFEGKLDLREAVVDGDIHVASSALSGDLIATDVSLRTEHVRINLAGTATVQGRIQTEGRRISYDLTEATVGELDIPGRALRSVSFRGATFDGFDFGAYTEELATQKWTLHREDTDATARELENLYLRAKNGATAIGENRAASQFFRHEMAFRRAGHWTDLWSADDVSGRLTAAGRWVSNTALKFTSGYGEVPTRPVVFSVVLVLVFAVGYAAMDAPVPYTSAIGYLTFSTEAFVALVIGQPRTTGLVLSSVVALEGFLGGFMIALFVFTLTRSINR